MTQLVCKNVKVVNTMTGELLDTKGVKKKFGVPPELIIDYLALIGDTSDNVPGVAKVGPKTAVKWLTEYKNIDGIVDNSENITGKVGENLRLGLEQLSLSKELVTIKKDVDLDVTIEGLKVQPADQNGLNAIYKDLEFRSWLDNKEDLPEIEEEKINSNYELVLNEKDLDKWIKKINKAETVAVDTETTGLNYMDAKLVGISLSTKPGEAAYIPFGHIKEEGIKQLSKKIVLEKLKPFLEDKKKKVIGQNLKFDRNVLAQHGVKLGPIKNDTMLMSYILDASATRHNLDALAKFYLNYKTTTFEEVAGKGVKQITFDQVPLNLAGNYASEDADITLRLYEKLNPLLNKQTSLKKLAEDIEIPLIEVLSDMEQAGTLVNSKVLEAQSKDLGKRLIKLEKEAYEIAGEEFQLGLYEATTRNFLCQIRVSPSLKKLLAASLPRMKVFFSSLLKIMTFQKSF